MQRRKMFFRMITASLMRRRSRMVIALLAIAVGSAILTGLLTIYFDVPRQLGSEFRNYGANMIVTAADDDGMTAEEMDEAVAVIDEAELVGAAPYRYETVRIHEQPIMAAGTDMEQAQKTAPYWSVEGEWPASSGELMIGNNVSEDLNLKVGDVVEVYYQPEDAADDEADNVIEFTAVGIVNTGGSEEDYVYMSMDDLETITEITDSIDILELSISSANSKLTAYMDEINETITSANAQLVKRVTASETTVLTKLQALILLVTIVVLALTMISVATTMTAVVAERRVEIGLRKAIGATDKEIMGEFMGEAVILGGFGGILGGFLGFVFAQIICVSIFSSSISFRIYILPFAIIVSIAVTAIACLIPVQSTTRIDPALVLKGE